MYSLLALALVLLLAWLWAIWQRDRLAIGMQSWSYTLLIGAVTCAVMAMGLWLRGLLG